MPGGESMGTQRGESKPAPVPREEAEVGAAEDRLAGAGSRSILFAQGAQSCTVLIFFQAALRM